MKTPMHTKYISALLLVALLGACSETQTTPTAASDSATELIVKIGTSAPLTGPQAHIGKDNENGARMAIEDANAKGIEIGGKKARFVLVSEDDQADGKTATIVAQKLVDGKINGVIGHMNSGTTIPASRIYRDNGLPQISPSATATAYTTQGFSTAFRVMANDSQQGRVLGEFATRSLGAKRIAVIDDRTAYGQGLADEFIRTVQANGAEIVAREYTNDKAVDFTAVLTLIKGKNPDLLFFGGMDPQGAPLIKQMRALALTAKIMMGDGGYTPALIRNAGDAAEGTYATLPGVPLDQMPQGKAFEQRYVTQFQQPIQLYAPYSYDAVNVMIAAMQKAGSADPEKYLPELSKTEHEGITSTITFDGKGDLNNGAVTLYQVQQGQWQPLQTLRDNASVAVAN